MTRLLPRLGAVCAGVGLLLAVGCATLPPAAVKAVPAPPDAARAVLDEWSARAVRQQSLQGLAKVRVETPQRTLNGRQVLVVDAPDRLRAETLSPFGTPLLVLAASGGRLAASLPGERLYYHGAATPENLGRFSRLPLRLTDLVDIFLGRPPLLPAVQLRGYTRDDGGLQIETAAGGRRQTLTFDRAHNLAEVSYFSGDELQLQLFYGDYAVDTGLPGRLEIYLPLQQTRASLVFIERAAGAPPGELFTLPPPAGARSIALDEAGGAVSVPPAESSR